MNRKLIELLSQDDEIAALEGLMAPVIVVKGRSLKYKNPACLKECLYNDFGRSCYTPYGLEISKIRINKGDLRLVYIPTMQGVRAAVGYGREEDTVFFFTNHAEGLNDAIAYAPDSARDAISFAVRYLLSGGKSIYEFCSQFRTRIGLFEETISYSYAAILIEQLCYRISSDWIYEKQDKYESLMLSTKELFDVLAELTDSLKICRPSSVETEVVDGGVVVLCDGISCGRISGIPPTAKARIMFWSTRSGLVSSSVIAFTAELIYGANK